jgi:hypothetical protein
MPPDSVFLRCCDLLDARRGFGTSLEDEGPPSVS